MLKKMGLGGKIAVGFSRNIRYSYRRGRFHQMSDDQVKPMSPMQTDYLAGVALD